MDLITTGLLAIALAMDSFAVSITSGITIKKLKFNNAIKIALFFSVAHALMLFLGWILGVGLGNLITGIDHWVAFGLLSVVGLKMIYDSTIVKNEKETLNVLNTNVLLVLAIATSIDSLAIGLSFAFLDIPIMMPLAVISTVIFITSFAGIFIGDKIGKIFKNKISIVGGIILIAIGVKILLEHLSLA